MLNSAKQVDAKIAEWQNAGLSKAQIIVNTSVAMMGWAYVWGAVGADCTVAKRQYYMGRSAIGPGDVELIRKRCQVLNGSASKCDGCKYYPNCERTRINDCQGFVKQVHKAAGITLTGGGCTSMWKNDALWSQKGLIKDMPLDQVCCVFTYVSSTGKMDHIGVHIGGGKIIHCSGEVKEGYVSEKRMVPWSHYAIAKGMDGTVPTTTKPTIRRGSVGPYVVECQTDLITLGYDLGKYGADGKFGAKTEEAVKAFQRDHSLTPDGIVGPATWDALDKAVGPSPEPTPAPKFYTVTIPHLTETQADELCKQYPEAKKTSE